MSEPLVSIIIPVFNRPALLREALASAFAEAATVNAEIIVVDDCSTDDTWEVMQTYGDSIRAMRMPQNGGQSAARNAGLAAARGKYVKFFDSDDLFVAGHLEKEVRRAEQENADIVVTGWREEMSDGSTRELLAPVFHNVVDELLAGVAVPVSGALYLRATCVPFDPALRKIDDWDFFLQNALGAKTIATEPGPSFLIRVHGGQRATDVTMLFHAREHHVILRKLEERLAADGRLSEARRKRLAQYFYKEARVLCLHDRPAFEKAMRHIQELDPDFTPREEERQRWMRVLARMIGARRAVLLHSRVKRLLRGSR